MFMKRVLITLILSVSLGLQAMAPNKPGMPAMTMPPAAPMSGVSVATSAHAVTVPVVTQAPVTPVVVPTSTTTLAVTPAPIVPVVVPNPTPTPAVVPAPVVKPVVPARVAQSVQQHDSTGTVNENLSEITLAAGSTHELDALTDAIQRYLVQAPGYVSYLHSEEQGLHMPATYTLVAPKDAKAGSFVVFKGEGAGMHPAKMEPAFKVTVTESKEALEKELPDFKRMVKEAWIKQEEAEARYFTDIKERFEQLREEIRSVWFDVSLADGNFEQDFLKEKGSIKTVSKKLSRMIVGEEKIVGTGVSGSISSLDPKIVSGKMGAIKKGSSTLWQLQITANALGSTQVTYTVDGLTYILPVFVEATTTVHEPLKELEKPGERKAGMAQDDEETAEDDEEQGEVENQDWTKELMQPGS